MNIVTFLLKHRETPKLVVYFLREKVTIPAMLMEIVKDFAEQITTTTTNLGHRGGFCV